MSGVRDYLAWHELYDDPGSSLRRRLGLVREVLRGELDARPGPVRVLSLCAGDGRDILGVLAERQDAARVSVTYLGRAAVPAEVSIRSFDDEDDRTALGVVRYDGPPVRLRPTQRWFTFVG